MRKKSLKNVTYLKWSYDIAKINIILCFCLQF